MRFIEWRWPALSARVPPDAKPLARKDALGLCTHAFAMDDFWRHSRGGKRFAAADVPHGFCWVGGQDRGGGEYVFGMWAEGRRRFWVCHQHMNLMGPTGGSFTPRLSEALMRWDRGDDVVVYSQPWGWYFPATQDFERTRSRPEDWAEQDRELAAAQKALDLEPSSAEAWKGLGNAYLSLRSLARAENCFRRAIAIAPDFSAAFNNLGIALACMDRTDDAIAAWRTAIALEPDDPTARENLERLGSLPPGRGSE